MSIIISIGDGSKYYTFVSNSLINQISLWRGYDFLARSDRWKREEITLLLIPGAVSDSPLLLILPFQIPREAKITRNLHRLFIEEFFLPLCVKER